MTEANSNISIETDPETGAPLMGLTDLAPRLPIAICPYCGHIYTEAMDTEGPGFWAMRQGHGLSVFSPRSQPRHCGHFVVVQRFLIPDRGEQRQPDLDERLPYVMGVALQDHLKTSAVMNSMRLFFGDDTGDLRRYSLYTITYYGESEYQVNKARMAIREDRPESDPGLLLIAPRDEVTERQWRDLKSWVERGRLSWLEKTPNGPRRLTGPTADFPFQETIPA